MNVNRSSFPIATPLLRINLHEGVVFAKVENQQTAGSIKGRVGHLLVSDAVKENPKITTVTDATSGNSGVANARAAAVHGLESVFFMPEAISYRARLVRREGAEVILVSGGMAEARDAAASYARGGSSVAYLNQFGSRLSVEAHAKGTAVEIAQQLPAGVKRVRVVAGSGTGGTLMGISFGLTERGYIVDSWVAIPVDPSGLFSKLIPGVADGASQFIDWNSARTVSVAEADALEAARTLVSKKGLAVGPSSGLNLDAARLLLRAYPPSADEAIVTVFADHAREYRESHPNLFKAA